MLIIPSMLIGTTSKIYTKEELQNLQSLSENEKKKFTSELSLIESNLITNDAVLILKELFRGKK